MSTEAAAGLFLLAGALMLLSALWHDFRGARAGFIGMLLTVPAFVIAFVNVAYSTNGGCQ